MTVSNGCATESRSVFVSGRANPVVVGPGSTVPFALPDWGAAWG